jgi:hypothetical protein
MGLENVIAVGKDGIEIKDMQGLRQMLDTLIYDAVFAEEEEKPARLTLVKEIAKAAGAVPASIQGLYEEMGRAYPGFTVPAINIRGLAYDSARAVLERFSR